MKKTKINSANAETDRARYIGHRCLVFAVALAALFTVAGAAVEAPAQEAVPVSGITEPIRDVMVRAAVAGVIVRLNFREGDQVKKGEPLLEFEKELEALEAERRKLIWEDTAELESAKARETTGKSLLDDNRALFESTKSISREELEKLELEYRLAVAERNRLQVVEKRERLEYKMALAALHKRTVWSPLDGVVTELMIEEGEFCEPPQELVRLVDARRCRLVCNVEENIGRRLQKGQKVALEIQTGSEMVQRTGVVVFVSPVVDSASGLMAVKAEFPNTDGSVRPGVPGFLHVPSTAQ